MKSVYSDITGKRVTQLFLHLADCSSREIFTAILMMNHIIDSLCESTEV